MHTGRDYFNYRVLAMKKKKGAALPVVLSTQITIYLLEGFLSSENSHEETSTGTSCQPPCWLGGLPCVLGQGRKERRLARTSGLAEGQNNASVSALCKTSCQLQSQMLMGKGFAFAPVKMPIGGLSHDAAKDGC